MRIIKRPHGIVFKALGCALILDDAYHVFYTPKRAYLLPQWRVFWSKFQNRFLPTFWAISLYSCDAPNPNCAFTGYVAWAWGHKSLNRLSMEANRSSDGPARVEKVSFVCWLKNRREK